MTTSTGRAVRLEGDDKTHPSNLYAEVGFGELYAGATATTITMAGSPAIKVLGNTQAGGANLATSVTPVGVTVDAGAGTFTVDRGGVYRLYLSGNVTGEDTEDITLEWQKNGTDLTAPHELLITIAAASASALTQEVAHSALVDAVAGDAFGLGVLGSASEVVQFSRFAFGIELLKSEKYD